MKKSFEDQHGTTEFLKPAEARTRLERLEADTGFQAARTNPNNWKLRQAAGEYEAEVKRAMAAPERKGDPEAEAELRLLMRDASFLSDIESGDAARASVARRHWDLVWRKAHPYAPRETPNPSDKIRELAEKAAA